MGALMRIGGKNTLYFWVGKEGLKKLCRKIKKQLHKALTNSVLCIV